MDHLLLSCIDSRIEDNRNLYGCFQLGPFYRGQGLTIGNAMRRTLLSELSGLAIVCVEIQGINHEYSNIKGIRESVLDILLNLKKIIFISNNYYTNFEIGFLKIQGPAIVKSGDLKLPCSLQCVDPNQYIATLYNNSCLEIKFMICKGKNFVIQTSFDLITEKFHYYFAQKKKSKKKFSIIRNIKNIKLKKKSFQLKKKNNARSGKKDLRSFKPEENFQKNTESFNISNKPLTSKNFLNLSQFRTSLKKSIYEEKKNTILLKTFHKEKKFFYFLRKKRLSIWRKKYFVNNFSCARNLIFLKKKLIFKKTKLIVKLEKKFFSNFENILLDSFLTVSNFQSFKNLIYTQNLKKNTATDIILIDPVFMPIVKVNYSIQNIESFYKIKYQTLITKFQKKTLTEKIILEIWTNGSIDPKNALYKSTQKIIENFLPFQKIYLTKKNKFNLQ